MRRLLSAAAPLLFLPLFACTGGTSYSSQSIPPAAAAREGHFDAGEGVRIGYRVAGTGRDTLVVIHGGPGLTMDYLAADLEPLAAGHGLIFYDQRGTGRSSLVTDSAALDAERFADDLEALRRHFGLDRLNLLGHSWGAGVVALYARRHPERLGRLLIVGGIPLQLKALQETFRQLDAARDTAERRRMQEAMQARRADPGDQAACRAYYVLWFRPFFRDSSAAHRSRGDFCAGTPEGRRNKIASVDRYTAASLGDWDWRPMLRAVEAPTLVMHGSADVIPLAYAREWAAAMPNSRLLVLEGVGHFPYVEAPAEFFPAVNAFLAGGWPGGAEEARAP